MSEEKLKYRDWTPTDTNQVMLEPVNPLGYD